MPNVPQTRIDSRLLGETLDTPLHQLPLSVVSMLIPPFAKELNAGDHLRRRPVDDRRRHLLDGRVLRGTAQVANLREYVDIVELAPIALCDTASNVLRRGLNAPHFDQFPEHGLQQVLQRGHRLVVRDLVIVEMAA